MQEVQGTALAGQQAAGGASQGEESLIGFDFVAVINVPIHLHSTIQLSKDLVHPGATAYHGVFAGNDRGLGAGIFGYQHGGDVSTANVFSEGLFNAVGDVGFEGVQIQIIFLAARWWDMSKEIGVSYFGFSGSLYVHLLIYALL